MPIQGHIAEVQDDIAIKVNEFQIGVARFEEQERAEGVEQCR
jgi:hypothetical protein